MLDFTTIETEARMLKAFDAGDVTADKLLALCARVRELDDRLSLVTEFRFAHLTIKKRSLCEDIWAVLDGSYVLSKDGNFEREPMPSNRSDEFIARTRFCLDEAFDRARAALGGE